MQLVDKLAQIIRVVDGNHDMSASNLADAIIDSGIFFEETESARKEVAVILRDAADRWEADGDDERLVNEVIDPFIIQVLGR